MPDRGSELEAIAARYLRFANEEARDVSKSYERLALAVAGRREVLAFIAALPPRRRQPNLLFAAARLLQGTPVDIDVLSAIVGTRPDALRGIILTRTTQTNEPARCAVLLPILGALPQPLALLEVGASAGLCLLPDRYGYDYSLARIAPPSPPAPVFSCAVSGAVPMPARAPQIAWRAGLDLNPLDIGSTGDVAWLEALVWPEQEQRLANLRRAIDVASRDPPRVVRGDLLTDFGSLAASAPSNATLVVFHTAVLAYVAEAEARSSFVDAVRRSQAIWISNEVPAVFPDIAARAPAARPPGKFLLSVDGVPKAWTGPHGQSLDWIA
jgi:hypothetical protein